MSYTQPNITYELLTEREVMMAGYDIGQVFFLLRVWIEMESRAINTQKRPISSHLNRTRDLLYGKNNIFLLYTAGNPERAR